MLSLKPKGLTPFHEPSSFTDWHTLLNSGDNLHVIYRAVWSKFRENALKIANIHACHAYEPSCPPKAVVLRAIKPGEQIKVMRDPEGILIGKLSRIQAFIFFVQNQHEFASLLIVIPFTKQNTFLLSHICLIQLTMKLQELNLIARCCFACLIMKTFKNMTYNRTYTCTRR